MRAHEILIENFDYVVKKYVNSPMLNNSIKNDTTIDKYVSIDKNDMQSAGVTVLEFLRYYGDPEEGKTRTFDWISNQYMQGNFKFEDIEIVRNSLEKFFKYKHFLQVKDLLKYRTIGDLYSTLEELNSTKVTQLEFNNLVNDVISTGGNKVLLKTPNFVVLELTEFKCSLKFASLTTWCTTQKKNFDNYLNDGPLYVIMLIHYDTMKFYQFQVESDQYKNSSDRHVTVSDITLLSSYPQYTEFLNMLIKKYYGKYLEGST